MILILFSNYKGIKIKIIGIAETRWTKCEGGGKSKFITYTGEQEFFKSEFFLIGCKETDMTLDSGEHVYNFAQKIEKDTPSSFKGKYGEIKFYVKVTVVRSWKFDQNFQIEFNVIKPIDLNLNEASKNRHRTEVDKKFGILCCISNPITMVVIIPHIGYVCGQKIPVKLEIDNTSDIKINHFIAKMKKV